MSVPILFAFLAMVLVVIHGQQIPEECSRIPGWSKYNGSCYKVFTSDMNYTKVGQKIINYNDKKDKNIKYFV